MEWIQQPTYPRAAEPPDISWILAHVEIFDVSFFPAIASLQRVSDWDIRLVHILDSRAHRPRRALAPAIPPTPPSADLLSVAPQTQRKGFDRPLRDPTRAFDPWYWLTRPSPFGFFDARRIMPAIHALLGSYRASAPVRWFPTPGSVWAFPFPIPEPSLLFSGMEPLLRVFRAKARSARVFYDTIQDASFPAWKFPPTAAPLRQLSDQPSPWIRWEWAESGSWCVGRPDAFDARLWPAIESMGHSFTMHQRSALVFGDQPLSGWLRETLPVYDPTPFPAMVQLLASFRTPARSTQVYHDRTADAWVHENLPPFDPTQFAWGLADAGMGVRRGGVPMETQFLAEPGIPRPLFPQPRPGRRPRRKC